MQFTNAPAAKMAESSDNLEYYIKFPSPNFKYDTREKSDDSIQINQDNIPVVILFGWAGAEDKYLSVYSKIYEEKGLITLRYTSPVKFSFWNGNFMVKIAGKLVKLLEDLSFENHPIFIHIFSNGGTIQYQFFSEALETSNVPLQIKGVIFDSAPAKLRILSIFRAMNAICVKNQMGYFILSVLMTLFYATMCLCDLVKSRIFNVKPRLNPLERLKGEENKWPQHFIYSRTDLLVPYQDVEYFANYRKSLGVDVTLKCYEDTPHVRHYPGNRTSYTRSIVEFMNKCL